MEIIDYQEIFQTSNVELIFKVIWQCFTLLLELFSRDKGRHTGGVGLPLTFGLPAGWIILAHSTENGTFISMLSLNL